MQAIFKFFILLIPVVVFLFYFSHLKNRTASILANIYLLSIVAYTLFGFGKYVYDNYDQPPKWDFLGFWLNGNVGIGGENFYNAESYREIALPYDPGNEFREEIIDTGFWYPPFGMFLFLPLGLFDISKAYLLWQASNLLLCIGCIYGLWKLFLKDYGGLSLLLVAVLMLRLEPTESTFLFSQTNFLTLLLFLIFWQNKANEWGGLWLALCVVVKPYMVLVYIYLLLTRKWKMLVIAILTLLILAFASALAFGSDVVITFMNNPIPETPSWNYTEVTNQSLLATILRSTRQSTAEGSILLNPLYIGISVLLTLITVWITIKKNNNQDWVILSILILALIVYPANQMFYSVFLIVPVVFLLKQPFHSIKARIIVLFIILITYFLSGYGDHMFFANVFMWLVCIILAAKSNFEKMPVSDPPTWPALL